MQHRVFNMIRFSWKSLNSFHEQSNENYFFISELQLIFGIYIPLPQILDEGGQEEH